MTAEYWIKKLGLLPHTEGGFFKETYRSVETVLAGYLPDRFSHNRNFSTAIYYLLEKDQRSVFHKIKSDELWHFYDGDPVNLYIIDRHGSLINKKVGITEDAFPQTIVPCDCWFAAESMGSYSLAGCTVSPGFDFSDFEMANRNKLLKAFPEHKEIIVRFTNK